MESCCRSKKAPCGAASSFLPIRPPHAPISARVSATTSRASALGSVLAATELQGGEIPQRSEAAGSRAAHRWEVNRATKHLADFADGGERGGGQREVVTMCTTRRGFTWIFPIMTRTWPSLVAVFWKMPSNGSQSGMQVYKIVSRLNFLFIV